MRTDVYKFKQFRKHVCGNARFAAMFIDSRSKEDDTPWDEPGDIITKNTPL